MAEIEAWTANQERTRAAYVASTAPAPVKPRCTGCGRRTYHRSGLCKACR